MILTDNNFDWDGQAFPKFQNTKFAISLLYLKNEVRNGVHFLHADKRQNFYKLALLF